MSWFRADASPTRIDIKDTESAARMAYDSALAAAAVKYWAIQTPAKAEYDKATALASAAYWMAKAGAP